MLRSPLVQCEPGRFGRERYVPSSVHGTDAGGQVNAAISRQTRAPAACATQPNAARLLVTPSSSSREQAGEWLSERSTPSCQISWALLRLIGGGAEVDPAAPDTGPSMPHIPRKRRAPSGDRPWLDRSLPRTR